MEFKHFVHVFNGKSYTEWECRLLAYLDYKEVLEVVEGKIPESDDTYTAKNKLARAIILAALDNTHVRMVSKIATASGMACLSYYSNATGTSHLWVNRTFAYIDRFKTCIEDVQSAGMNIEPKFSVHVFFNSLDARFDTLVNFYSNTFQNGVAIDDGTLQKLFTALIQQEIRNKSTTHDAALNTSRHGPKHNGRPHHKQQQSIPSSVTCSYCNKRNHSEDECRIKAADERRQSESSNSTSRRARFQDTDDNTLANTRQNQRSTQRSYGRSSSPVSMMAACHTLLQVNDNLDSSNEWILDSGATDHYCKDISWFTTLELFTGKVRVANGDDINIEGRGTIELEMNTPSGIVPIRMTDV
ncbi:hypothetical protein LEN26_015675, partial [Aphanomyces euteiches]